MQDAVNPDAAHIGTRWTVVAALAANAGLAAAKFAAASMTGSSALLAQGVHSMLAASSQALSLLGLEGGDRRLALGQSSSSAPNGDGTFWALVVPILLYSFGAGVAVVEGAQRLAMPRALGEARLAYAALGIAAVLMAASLWSIRKRWQGGHQGARDSALLAVSVQSAGGLAGALIALGGLVLTERGGVPGADALATILVGLTMAWVASRLALEIRRMLVAAPGRNAARQAMAAASARSEAQTLGQPAASVASVEIKTPPRTEQAVPVSPGSAAARSEPGPKPAVVVREQGKKGRGKRRR